MYEEQDDLYKALGSKSMRDFYDRVAYLGSDTEAELNDDETDDDDNDDANHDTDNDTDNDTDGDPDDDTDGDTNDDTDNDTSSVEDVEDNQVLTDDNTFRTPIQPVLTKHLGFPNLKYLYLGSHLGSAKFRYFCRKAEGRDQVQFVSDMYHTA